MNSMVRAIRLILGACAARVFWQARNLALVSSGRLKMAAHVTKPLKGRPFVDSLTLKVKSPAITHL